MMLRVLTEGLPVAVVPSTTGGGAPTDARSAADGLRICDITEDSRTVMPGSLFVARKGERADGNAFIAAAVAAGASAVLSDNPAVRLPAGVDPGGRVLLLTSSSLPDSVAAMAERFFGNPSSRLAMIGITGTKGKTTCAYLTRQLLGAGGSKCGLIGTVCIDDGVEVAPALLTTPPALELSRTIARMVDAGCTACVMETSSHALDQGRAAALAYRVGVFTNLGHDHLDYHHTLEAYAGAKARLFGMLPDAALGGVAVVNADDPWCETMLKGCRAGVVRCSMKSRPGAAAPPIDCSARIVSESPAGTVIDVHAPFTGDRSAQVFLPLIGAHNVMNAVQAACAAFACGVDGRVIAEALTVVSAPPGRMEPVTGDDAPFAVYVDYAHTPDSLSAVLTVARRAVVAEGKGGRVLALFGCGGDRDATKRPRMGAAAAGLADVVFISSDNPRTEDPVEIIRQIVAGVLSTQRAALRIEADRRAAIDAAVAECRAGDVLLIAGKGHEDYQVLSDNAGGTRKIHFDDREQAIAALRARDVAAAAFVPGCLIPPARHAQPHHATAVPGGGGPIRHTARPRPADPTGENR
ncbi:MAG: UDP-N-acetylmuramoyl-L-alanyl-D-glutamate--2,6-diaminopimelate ligase [Phycisphaerales bacterium]|nr:UDP-N-acetylmuramoyl-L-alanyl-D-glutamate--2,6-diaminopimelate ligase [Phycisphaerales bacterium]